jgi:F-type H+-transporting ATPase subunit b
MKRLHALVERAAPAWAFLLVALLPQIAAAAEAAGHEEPGIINLNITILIQAINLIILVLLLSKFLFKPLTKFLADRSEGIAKSLDEARAAREAAARAHEEYQAQIRETQKEAAVIREQVRHEVETERQRLLQASREEAQSLLASAKAEIEAETRRAKASLREEAVGLAIGAAERLLGRIVSTEDQKRLADQYVRDLGSKN